MCNSYLADEKNTPSAKDMATILEHLKSAKQELKYLEEDMAKISAYTYKQTYAPKQKSYGGHSHAWGFTSGTTGCEERDPYVAASSILGNGFVNVRPGDLCQRPAAGIRTYGEIIADRKNQREAWEMNRWSKHHQQFNSPTKKEEPVEQKDQREQREQREREQREQKEQKEQKPKGAQ
jgi:hypothetical protein